MILQKQLSRKVGNKEYVKYVVIIPPLFINLLKWDSGLKLRPHINEGSLVLESTGITKKKTEKIVGIKSGGYSNRLIDKWRRGELIE